MTLNRQESKHWAAIFVVLVGWVLGLATTHILKPTNITPESYTLFYTDCIMLRNALFVISIAALYYVGGSVAIWLLVGFNLVSILLNIFYLTPSNYSAIQPWRVGYFAPAYKAAELIIIIGASWNVRSQIYTHASYVCYRLRYMVVCWRLYFKKAE